MKILSVSKAATSAIALKITWSKILGLVISISDLKCVTGLNYVISLISLKRHTGFENVN